MQKIINIYLFILFSISLYAQNPVACYPLDSSIVRDAITGSMGQHSAGAYYCPDRHGNPRGAMRLDLDRYGVVNLGNNNNLYPQRGTVSIWVKMYHHGGLGQVSGVYPPIIKWASGGYNLVHRWQNMDFYYRVNTVSMRF
jgi:hypothetical protein